MGSLQLWKGVGRKEGGRRGRDVRDTEVGLGEKCCRGRRGGGVERYGEGEWVGAQQERRGREGMFGATEFRRGMGVG